MDKPMYIYEQIICSSMKNLLKSLMPAPNDPDCTRLAILFLKYKKNSQENKKPIPINTGGPSSFEKNMISC